MSEQQSVLHLAPWQSGFIDAYTANPKAKSVLIAAPGTGKTRTGIALAARMMSSGVVDSTLVLTNVLVLRDQWLSAARNYGIDLADTLSADDLPDGAVVTVQSLRSEPLQNVLAQVAKGRRWLVIADEPHYDRRTNAIVDQVLIQDEANKALFLSSTALDMVGVDAEFDFDTEFITDRALIVLPNTEVQLARYAPSFFFLRKLERSGSGIDELSWREFERLIATLLERDGYEVELMQGSKDGGVDVVAIKDLGPGGFFKCLWQAKKKSLKNKVGISIVRELADTRQELGASKGVIVTTSYLTRGAMQRVDRDRYLLAKVDRDDLDSWVKRTLLGHLG